MKKRIAEKKTYEIKIIQEEDRLILVIECVSGSGDTAHSCCVGKYRINKKSAGGGKYVYYRVKLPVGRDHASGTIVQHDVTGCSTEELVCNVRSLMKLSDEEMRISGSERLLGQIAEDWFAFGNMVWQASTLPQYRAILKNLEDEGILGTAARDVTDDLIITWQERWIAAGISDGGMALRWEILGSVIGYAIKRRYMAYDPMRYTKIFIYRRPGGSLLSEDQIKELLIDNSDCRYATVYAVLLLTGMRIGEALGLSWRDIDEEAGTILIHQQSRYDSTTHDIYIKQRTKSGNSRLIRPPKCCFWYLHRQREAQRALAAKPAYDNSLDLVFTDPKGGILAQNKVAAEFNRKIGKKNNNDFSPHDLRSTCATYAVRLSGDIDAVQHYIGHKHKTTLLSYMCTDDKAQRALADIMNGHMQDVLGAAAVPQS